MLPTVTARCKKKNAAKENVSAPLHRSAPVLGYVSAYATVPGTHLSFGAEVKANNSMIDTTFKAKYQTPFVSHLGVEGGYRLGRYMKSDFSGMFVGAFATF